jgi:hypothetical protein
MNLATSSRRLIAAAGALVLLGLSQPLMAQEVSETHLAAARSAVGALGITNDFDNILPGAAQALKNELIQRSPHQQADIIKAVDDTAISLASRRGDLEREVALVYARVFNEAELKAIGDFYSSEAGKKLNSDGQIAMREVMQAVEIWQRGVARDLAVQVADKIEPQNAPKPQQ